jgi:hypothetical protein
MFCAPGLVMGGTEGSGSRFMFCAPGLILGDTEGAGSCFHVLRSHTHFGRYRGRQVPFSCFAIPDSFSAVLRVPSQIFIFRTPWLIFGGTEGIGSRFHVLRFRTHFGRYRGLQVSFSYFAPRLVLGGTEGVESRFHVLLSRTRFKRYRARWVQFSCFVLLDSFWGGTEGVRARFLILRSRTHFQRYRGRRVPFLYFALRNSFSTVLRALGLIFMFCASGPILAGTEGVGSSFHILRFQPRFRRNRGRQVPFLCFALPDSFPAVPRASGLVFMFCTPWLVSGETEGAESRFHVSRSWTCFRRYWRRRVPFSFLALPDSFSAVPRALGTVFMFYAPVLVFDGVRSNFHV